MVRKGGGAKRLIESALIGLDHLAAEIHQDVATIRRKKTELFHLEIITTAHAASRTTCRVLLGVHVATALMGFILVSAYAGGVFLYACDEV
jgi:hypothetical protein